MANPVSGGTFNAASLQTPMSNLATAINALDEVAFRRWALTERNLPRLLPVSLFTQGMSRVGAHFGSSTTETYQTYQEDSGGTSTLPPDYQRFGTAGPLAPYGAPATVDTGWRIPAINNTIVESARIDAGSSYDPRDAGKALQYARCRLNVDLRGTFGGTALLSVLLAIGCEDGSGNRGVFTNSVRWFSEPAYRRGPIGTSFFFSQADDAAALGVLGVDDTDIKAFFGVISSRRRIGSPSTDRADPEIGCLHFTAIPLMAGAL